MPLRWPLWLGIVLPFVASHSVSWVALLLAPFIQRSLHWKLERKAVLKEALAIACIHFQFELAWMVQIIMLSTDTTAAMTTALQSIFIATSGCLGITSFIYFCFLQPHMSLRCNNYSKTPQGNGPLKSPATPECAESTPPIVDQSHLTGESGLIDKLADL